MVVNETISQGLADTTTALGSGFKMVVFGLVIFILLRLVYGWKFKNDDGDEVTETDSDGMFTTGTSEFFILLLKIGGGILVATLLITFIGGFA